MYQHQPFRIHNFLVFPHRFDFLHHCKVQTWVLCCERTWSKKAFLLEISQCLQQLLWSHYLWKSANNHQHWRKCSLFCQVQELRFCQLFAWWQFSWCCIRNDSSCSIPFVESFQVRCQCNLPTPKAQERGQ